LKQVTLKNDRLSLEVLDYGAIIHKLKYRTGDGTWNQMNVSRNAPGDYLKDPFAMGACVGRYAGRLSGNLELEGETFPLPAAEGITLHGGERGFARRYWEIRSVSESPKKSEVHLGYRSRHLEEGFPGNLDVALTYTLSGNTLIIRHEARTDRPTAVNLTNHTYFKLDSHPVISHYHFRLHAGRRAETDDRLLPTGRLLPVGGSPYDFRAGKDLGEIGLDTPFLLDAPREYAARLSSPVSGIRLTMHTDQPAVVVYIPDRFAGICLEAQNLPDAPRYSHFPNCFLYPGEVYLNESHFVFESPE
jgi:aldose 1-epimerase